MIDEARAQIVANGFKFAKGKSRSKRESCSGDDDDEPVS